MAIIIPAAGRLEPEDFPYAVAAFALLAVVTGGLKFLGVTHGLVDMLFFVGIAFLSLTALAVILLLGVMLIVETAEWLLDTIMGTKEK